MYAIEKLEPEHMKFSFLRWLNECELKELVLPVNHLLNRLDGLALYIESEEQLPIVQLSNTLARVYREPINVRYNSVLSMLCHLDAFYYQVEIIPKKIEIKKPKINLSIVSLETMSDEGNSWDPLKVSFYHYTTNRVVHVWEGWQPFPSPVSVKRWLLRQMITIV